MGHAIGERSIIVASQDQVSCDLAGDAAILDIKSGIYYGLTAVGAWIWNLMDRGLKLRVSGTSAFSLCLYHL
jgi:hypothetical protein